MVVSVRRGDFATANYVLPLHGGRNVDYCNIFSFSRLFIFYIQFCTYCTPHFFPYPFHPSSLFPLTTLFNLFILYSIFPIPSLHFIYSLLLILTHISFISLYPFPYSSLYF